MSDVRPGRAHALALFALSFTAALLLTLPAAAQAVVPAFSLSEPANNQKVKGSVGIQGYSSNVDVQITCNIPNNSPGLTNWNCTYMNRWVSSGVSIFGPEGSRTITVTAVAQDGSNQSTTVNRTIIVDRTAPTISINSGPRFGNSYPGHDFSWTFSANETASFECKLDGEDWAGCSSPYSRTDVPDGAHVLYVRATDEVANQSGEATASFTVNNAPPEATIDFGPESGSLTNDSTPTWGIGKTRDDALLECRVDGGLWGECSTEYTAPELTDGTHTFQVRAYLPGPTDIQNPPTSRSFVVDTTPPTPFIVSPPDHEPGSSVTFEYGADEPVDTFICVLDPDGDNTMFWPCDTSFSGLPAGEHSLLLWAIDDAGNFTPEDQGVLYTWKQYPSPPNTSIVTKPDPVTPVASAGFTFSSDTGSSFECSIDGGAYSSCVSPMTVSGLSGGSHAIQVRAKDPAGQVDPSPDSAVFNLLAPPPAEIAPRSAKLKTKTVSFTTSAGASFKVTIAKCVKKKGKKKKVCRKVSSSSGTADAAGSVTLKLKKKLTKRVSYRVTIVATSADGTKTTLVKNLKAR